MSAGGHSQLEAWIRTACLAEATAPKPGNVHPGAAFDDLCFEDFVTSAHAASPALARARTIGVGRAALDAVTATRQAVGRNTNLGICLLIAPLAVVPSDVSLAAGIGTVLEHTTVDDARLVYEAIRIANPAGMRTVGEQDLRNEPSLPLTEVMSLAAERDRIAWQYAHGFNDVLGLGVETLEAWGRKTDDWRTGVVGLAMTLLSEIPDSHIGRKLGVGLAVEASRQAKSVLIAGWPETTAGREALAQFDRWLRADGHRRNPGTTADFVTAVLFAALRDGRWPFDTALINVGQFVAGVQSLGCETPSKTWPPPAGSSSP